MNENLVLIAVFVAVLLLVFTAMSLIIRRRDIRQNIDDIQNDQAPLDFTNDIAFASDNDDIRHYYEVQKKSDPNGLDMRLIQAGYFNRDAKRVFNLIRILITATVFVVSWYVLVNLSLVISPYVELFFAALISAVGFILVSAVLDNMVKNNQIQYRRLFPDFMDLLIVCADSGMSIEAAIDRVAREFTQTQPKFGRHLSIISLEVRAGRPLHEALNNFSVRVKVDEARTLAVLFKQSQELGSSIIKTLRVFSKEMRQNRLLRAEEKANSLPVKMLFPMAGFMFPVNLLIVLVPIMMQLLKMMSTMSPPG